MPEIPEGTPKGHAKKKSAEARKAEADGFAVIEQNGIGLRIPLGEHVPLAAYMAFKDNDEMRGTELLVGSEQWAEFMATNPTVGDFAEIGRQLTELLGN